MAEALSFDSLHVDRETFILFSSFQLFVHMLIKSLISSMRTQYAQCPNVRNRNVISFGSGSFFQVECHNEGHSDYVSTYEYGRIYQMFLTKPSTIKGDSYLLLESSWFSVQCSTLVPLIHLVNFCECPSENHTLLHEPSLWLQKLPE